MWPCVLLGGGEMGAGRVIRAPVLWLYTSLSNIWTLVQRIHQLQAEQAQAFGKLEEYFIAVAFTWLMLVQDLRLRGCCLRTPLPQRPQPVPARRPNIRLHALLDHSAQVTQAFATSWEVLGVKAELASPGAERLLACHVRSLLLQQTLATCRCLLLQSLISPAVACWAYSVPSTKGRDSHLLKPLAPEPQIPPLPTPPQSSSKASLEILCSPGPHLSTRLH